MCTSELMWLMKLVVSPDGDEASTPIKNGNISSLQVLRHVSHGKPNQRLLTLIKKAFSSEDCLMYQGNKNLFA
jgi:uncharacterized protein YggU (UPF0235/DUF167 family)